ncbi:FAD/NAD(P)-binding domain-containing protein [Byssothecium circinans]|uniref:FAD/NAD(P)-binding domain-containing protein n=1 Tax=Byssothecium circinans TaxID=147558 RepID=A0A6A5UDB8_9PLEO|nr:FAD/NAD(P)-binding domain-containing protein [Byssothecium circinans]
MGTIDGPEDPAMNVGIVGAGIAGLAAAIALRRAGHEVEVFEKSSFKREIGAAILLTPNGNRVLRRWGFDFEKAGGVDFGQWRFVNANTLEVVAQDSFADVEEQFGERMCAYHRVDLHSGLRDLAQRYGARIRLGAEIVDVKPEEGTVEVSGGEIVKKDFWVLADGCHTPFLPKITQETHPNHKIGKSVYRWLAPFPTLLQHPSAAHLWSPSTPPGFCTFFNNAITLVTYPCRNSTLLSCALFHDTRPEERDKSGWDANSSHDNVLELLEGCHEMVRGIPLAAEEEVKVYTMTQRPPSQTVARGKMLCVGDTTHHMLPTHAQGGCMALEDAGALEVLFAIPRSLAAATASSTSSTSSSSSSSLPDPPTSVPATFTHTPQTLAERLALFTALRLPRSATTQILSSTNPRFTMANLDSKTKEIRRFYRGELPDWPLGVGIFSRPVREFFYGYDVFAEAGRAVVWWDGRGSEGRGGGEGEGEVRLPEGWRWFGELSEESRMKGFFVEDVPGGG